MKYFTLLLLSLLFLQCNNNPKKDDKTAEKTTQTKPVSTTAAPTQAVATYPSITEEKMKYIYENCDYIDFIFYETDFSMSQNQRPAIIQTIGGVSTTPAPIDASCKPVGRLFFQVQGTNALEADLFFTGTCMYYIFLENGTYAYANLMTPQAATFYQKIFAEVSTKRPQ